MNARHRRELVEAINAHRAWLGRHGQALPPDPEVLDVLRLNPRLQVPAFPPGGALSLQRAKYASRGRKRDKSVWHRSLALRPKSQNVVRVPASVPDIVLGSLRSLCGLQLRVELDERRKAQQREAAARRQSSDHQAAARQAKLVHLSHDATHIKNITNPLRVAGQRARTAEKALDAFLDQLKQRHRAYVAAGGAGVSPVARESGLTRWLATACAMLDARIEYYLAELEGAPAKKLTGHEGAADAKALHRIRGDTRLWLSEAGAPTSLAVELFPDSRGVASEPDEKRLQQKRGAQEIKRAKKRAESER